MATVKGGNNLSLSLSASGDLNGKQYYFVQPATDAGKVEGATGGSGPAALGVLQNDPRSGEAAHVCVAGPTQVVSSTACGNIGHRDWIVSGSDGQAVLANGAGSAINGIALEANSAGSGVYISAFIFPSPLSGSGNFTDNTP